MSGDPLWAPWCLEKPPCLHPIFFVIFVWAVLFRGHAPKAYYYYYFSRVIKNEGRGLPPALARVAAVRHARTGARSGGPPGHSGAVSPAVYENPPFRDHPKMNYLLFFLGNLKPSPEGRLDGLSPCDSDASQSFSASRARQKYHEI